jgi:hypothetical protein
MNVYPHTFSGRVASQMEDELKGYIELLKSRNVLKYLEIGARHGDTFHEIMINLPKGSLGVAVDLPGALWGKRTTADALRKAVTDLRKRGYEAHYILGDSRSEEVLKTVRAFAPFDAVLIDGDHTYQGVKTDYVNYSPFAPLIAFHDITGDGQREKVYGNPVEVPRFWNELKGNKTEFVAEGSKMGIGVIENAIDRSE